MKRNYTTSHLHGFLSRFSHLPWEMLSFGVLEGGNKLR